MRRHPEERGYYGFADDAADEFFRQAAKAEGLSFPEWCRRSGILDRQALQKITKREAPFEEIAYKRPQEQVIARKHGPNWRTGRDGDRNFVSDPPFVVRTASVVEPPALHRPVATDTDAAAE